MLKQYYLACLSQASYLVGDTVSGRAVVVDPQRDVAQYLADAKEQGLTIERVIESHFHADFLSGHLELAGETGAKISYGSAAAGLTDFDIDPLVHGQRLTLHGEFIGPFTVEHPAATATGSGITAATPCWARRAMMFCSAKAMAATSESCHIGTSVPSAFS